ncbi:transglutaminase domain-containing protein [Clostridium sp. 19966]|uniref:DUF3488 and transglutaminase-like domain-containing protein n=1 Tax=Clostridium sp. 19966 TaxID=2768166 RepID=UPI0028EEE546|nr:transglutaminase domain-containing protein [Clostridium sp. 19966]
MLLDRNDAANLVNGDIISNVGYIDNQLQNYGYVTFKTFMSIFTLIEILITICLYFLYDIGIKNAVQLLLLFEVIALWQLQYYKEIEKCLFGFLGISIFTFAVNNFQRKKAIFHINTAVFLVWTMLISIFVGFIAVKLPKIYASNYENTIIDSINSNGKSIDSKSSTFLARYGLDSSGYSSTEKKLGGPIKLNDSVAFEVKSSAPYYLVGDVKDEYTGYSWRKSQVKYDKGSSIGDYYINSDVLRGMPDNIFDESKIKTLTIIPEGLNTTSLFVPKYPIKIIDNLQDTFHNEEEGTFLSSRNMVNEYTVSFYDVNLVNLTCGALVSYNSDKYSKYLKLPKSVSQRTEDLVYDIVKNCSTNEEKVKAIRDYLSENYKYTLNASELPQGKDFVDYFLFDDKKGYCVHFATAMTIMYRIAGIPARFVEGFKMLDNPNSSGMYMVKNSQAHAWTEYMVKPNVWEISDAAPTAEEEVKPTTTEENTSPVSYQPNQISNSNEDKNNSSANENSEQNADSSTNIQNSNYSMKLYIIAVIIILAAVIILIGLIQRKMIDNIIKDKSSIKLYKYIKKRLRSYRIIKPYNITDKEFIEKMPAQLYIILQPLIAAVYDEFYGKIISESLDKRQIYNEIEIYLRQESKTKKEYFLKKLFAL